MTDFIFSSGEIGTVVHRLNHATYNGMQISAGNAHGFHAEVSVTFCHVNIAERKKSQEIL